LFRLYRVISPDELADIATYGGFRPGPNSILGKWFAEEEADGRRWGQLLYLGGVFHVVQLDIPQDVADLMFRLPLLDQIGPARYADGEVLELINRQHQGICEVPLTISGGP
jgi:hypothetical protein